MPRLVAVLMFALLSGLLAGTTGCGGTGSVSLGSGVAAGTYEVTVTGTDEAPGSLEPQVSTTFTVVVP